MDIILSILAISAAIFVANEFIRVRHPKLHDKIVLKLKDYWQSLKNYF